MARGTPQLAHDLARSAIGAVNIGLPLLYTMETWWLAWRLPAWLLLAFAIGGLLAIAAVTIAVGIDPREEGRVTPLRRLPRAFVELLFTSFVTAYAVLLLFGIVEWGDSLQDVARLGLVQVVPLGLGAAIANALLKGTDDEEDGPPPFAKEMATFALGAALFSMNIAPTEEMELMAAHAGWWRLLLVAAVSVVATYLVLYHFEFKGRSGRLAGMGAKHLQWGETLAGYAIALAVAAGLLFGYGHFLDATWEEAVQKTVVLSMSAAFGGAAARVVI